MARSSLADYTHMPQDVVVLPPSGKALRLKTPPALDLRF